MYKFLTLEQDLIELLEKINNIIYNLDEWYVEAFKVLFICLIIIIVLLFLILLYTFFNFLQNMKIRELMENQQTETYHKKTIKIIKE